MGEEKAISLRRPYAEQSTIVLGFLGDVSNAFTQSDVHYGHLKNPGGKPAHFCMKSEGHRWAQFLYQGMYIQGIIDSKRTETFAKEPTLAELLRELKSAAVSYHKRVHWFFSYVCNGKSSVFWVLCCGITCKWVLFLA